MPRKRGRPAGTVERPLALWALLAVALRLGLIKSTPPR